MIEKQPWDEYAATYDDRRCEPDRERIEGRTFYHRMMDIWGEVDQSRRAWLAWERDRTPEKLASLEKHMESVNRACYLIYNDEAQTPAMKSSLRIAEWELYDFFFWDNAFHNTAETVTRWFDQWCYDYSVNLRVFNV